MHRLHLDRIYKTVSIFAEIVSACVCLHFRTSKSSWLWYYSSSRKSLAPLGQTFENCLLFLRCVAISLKSGAIYPFHFKVSCNEFNAVKYILLSSAFLRHWNTDTHKATTNAIKMAILISSCFICNLFQRLYKCAPPFGKFYLHQATNVTLLSVMRLFCVSAHQRASVCIFGKLPMCIRTPAKTFDALIAWDYATEIAIWCQLPKPRWNLFIQIV